MNRTVANGLVRGKIRSPQAGSRSVRKTVSHCSHRQPEDFPPPGARWRRHPGYLDRRADVVQAPVAFAPPTVFAPAKTKPTTRAPDGTIMLSEPMGADARQLDVPLSITSLAAVGC